MSSEYINSRFEELGDGEDKVSNNFPISGDDSVLGGVRAGSFHYHYSIKRIEFVKEENTVYLHF
ncbi:MAG: hypothetical protein CM15mP58_08460 [Burkholderiaceae bacterium]|nr:MAG: hypothetical protein CM15mP58_08460 [Burkholderiaceae bacterium]